MFNIAGRIAFVTGAASGIGLAIAEKLISHGAKVAMADIDRAALEAKASILGESALPVVLDVRHRRDWLTARTRVEKKIGPVSILINNAGIGPNGQQLADMDPASFERLLRIKLFGTFNGIQTFVPGMRAMGGGHIVNTASIAGLLSSANLGGYCASKAAVIALSEVLRAEVKDDGIGVSVLCPGLVATNLIATTERAEQRRLSAKSIDGISPAAVGALVIDAILENRAYIFTDCDRRPAAAERFSTILGAFDEIQLHS